MTWSNETTSHELRWVEGVNTEDGFENRWSSRWDCTLSSLDLCKTTLLFGRHGSDLTKILQTLSIYFIPASPFPNENC